MLWGDILKVLISFEIDANISSADFVSFVQGHHIAAMMDGKDKNYIVNLAQ